MTDKLQEICASKLRLIAEGKAAKSFSVLDNEAREAAPIRGFSQALETKTGAGKTGLIAEIKKASPSAGLIRPDFSPKDLARDYETAGAACLSVLTDAFFQGKNEDLVAARNACSLPVLRKDFMLDVWQVAEARSLGADCILLIMAAISDAQAYELHACAISYGMDVIIETHDEKELERALKLPSGLIGINNRNLKTLATDLSTTERLAPLVPKGRTTVGESGIRSADDIKRLKAVGINCFLVGETLLKQKNVVKATQSLLD